MLAIAGELQCAVQRTNFFTHKQHQARKVKRRTLTGCEEGQRQEGEEQIPKELGCAHTSGFSPDMLLHQAQGMAQQPVQQQLMQTAHPH